MVSAAALKKMDSFDKDDYICGGCGMPATPCACTDRDPPYKKSPYFKVDHEDECDIDGVKKRVPSLKKLGVGDAKSTDNILQNNAPYKLVRKKERPVTEPNLTVNINKTTSKSQSKNSSGNSTSQSTRNGVANNIFPICEAFMKGWYRADSEIEIPDVSGKTCADIFMPLKSKVIQYKKSHIFYASIRWKQDQDLKINEDPLILNVLLISVPYKIQVNGKAWSEENRIATFSPIEAVRQAVKKKWKAEVDKKWIDKTAEEGWLFFVGKQDQNDPAIFHVQDHDLICCIFGEMPRI